MLADALQRDAQNLVALVLHLGQAGKAEAMHVTQGLVDRDQLADGDQRLSGAPVSDAEELLFGLPIPGNLPRNFACLTGGAAADLELIR